MMSNKTACKNYLKTDFIYALISAFTLFIFVFTCIRYYLYCIVPINPKGADHNFYYVILVLFILDFMLSIVGITIISNNPFAETGDDVYKLRINGRTYNFHESNGKVVEISEPSRDSGNGVLALVFVTSFFIIPYNLIKSIILIPVILTSKKYVDLYSDANTSRYWVNVFYDPDEKGIKKFLYTKSFIFIEYILSIIIIILTYI